ncbi:MAG: DUF4157 domain-containing protein [Nodularia sp. CChRGM 3473]
MYSRIRKPFPKASSSESSSKNQFAPRSFKVPTPEEVTPQQEQTPDLQTQSNNTEQLDHGLLNPSVFRYIPPAPIPRLQMKLTIGQPGDKYEQQADKVAADVVQQINVLQRQELVEEDKLQRSPMIQRLSGEAGMAATPELEASIQQAQGSGQPLAKSLRESMERAFGANFNGVKVHTDSQSDQLNQSIQAKAFTTGQDIFFRQGEYNPGSRGGQELIAHELTHVVQQTGKAQTVQRTMPKEFEIKPQATPQSTSLLDAPIPEEIAQNLDQPLQPDDASVLKYQELLTLGKSYKDEELLHDLEDAKLFGYEKEKDFQSKAGPHGKAVGGVVKHVQDNEREQYELTSKQEGDNTDTVFYWRGQAVDTTEMHELVLSGAGGRAIFVMTADGKIYLADPTDEIEKGEALSWRNPLFFDKFHHSSFLRGAPVAAAGELVFAEGILKQVTNQSGHYKPGIIHTMQVLQEFKERGVNLKNVELELLLVIEGQKSLVTFNADQALECGIQNEQDVIKAVEEGKLDVLGEKEIKQEHT